METGGVSKGCTCVPVSIKGTNNIIWIVSIHVYPIKLNYNYGMNLLDMLSKLLDK